MHPPSTKKKSEDTAFSLGRKASTDVSGLDEKQARLDNPTSQADQVVKEEERHELTLEERLAEADKILAKWEEEEPIAHEPKQCLGGFFTYGYKKLEGEPTQQQIDEGIAVHLTKTSTKYVHWQERRHALSAAFACRIPYCPYHRRYNY